MKLRWIMRLCLTALLVYLARAGWLKFENNPGLLFLYFVFAGALGGFLFVKCALPWMIEAITTSLFSSGEKIKPEDLDDTDDPEVVPEDKPAQTEER